VGLERLIAFGFAALGVFAVYDSLRSKKVFVSYKYDGDAKYKNLLIAWSKHHRFNIEFDDVSSDISINSRVETEIKAGILPHIKDADIFLCIVGEKTYKSKMVPWEIERAVTLRKKIVAVKTSMTNKTPKGLKSVGAIWAMSFTEKEIVKALNKAAS
jgi:hypothetical protein